jgi:hypothetical protein
MILLFYKKNLIMKQKYILFVVFSFFFLKGIAQNPQTNYSVTSIPFQPYAGSISALSTVDDINSPLINLPFSIDFYGSVFNQVVISTNGYIDFRIASAGQNSPWSISQTVIPNTSFPVKMSVLGCYHDMNNSDAQGTISYGSYGTAPYRKFVVYYNNNSHYQCNASAKSSFQIILHETSNIVDVQLIDKQVCGTWNGGRAVTGLINLDGTQAITPPGRNVSSWTASQEGWRFSRPGYYPNYSFVTCDDNGDGFDEFNLAVAAQDLLPSNPSSVLFYETAMDAQLQSNPLPTLYSNILPNQQAIYASYNGAVSLIILSVIDCTVDADNDSVPTDVEDVNNDTNLANDDTDGDGIPNYLDNDDDGDLILTNLEYVFLRNAQLSLNLTDTDNDGIPNYLDNDDDGDGVLTWREDYDGDANPSNDDTNNNGTPDYLEFGVALGVQNTSFENLISLYPNPASSIIYIENTSTLAINAISIYSINGSLLRELNDGQNFETIPVSDLASGVYFIKIKCNDKVVTKKFVKN